MNPFLAIFLGLIPIIGIPALLIGLFALTTRRKTQRSESLPSEATRSGVVPAPADWRPGGVDVQLTAVLPEAGEVLLGYRTLDASGGSHQSSTDVFPLATGILLVRPRHEDSGATLSTLERWSKEGTELALRGPDGGDLVALCDRRTSERLVLGVLSAPRD
jgi:hypothetical protein